MMHSLNSVHIPVVCVDKLSGVLGAPFPFILGIHTSMLDLKDCNIGEETVQVFLDDNRIDYGSLGPSPPLPEKRARKLFNQLVAAGPIFEKRGREWKFARLANFDNPYSTVMEHPACCVTPTGEVNHSLVNEGTIRTAFLQFFVSIFKNYRK